MYLQEQKAVLENEVLRKQVRTKPDLRVKIMNYLKLTFEISNRQSSYSSLILTVNSLRRYKIKQIHSSLNSVVWIGHFPRTVQNLFSIVLQRKITIQILLCS